MSVSKYINKELKKVSKAHLMKVLKDLNTKHEVARLELQKATNEALQSGFYCTGGRPNIKPLL